MWHGNAKYISMSIYGSACTFVESKVARWLPGTERALVRRTVGCNRTKSQLIYLVDPQVTAPVSLSVGCESRVMYTKDPRFQTR